MGPGLPGEEASFKFLSKLRRRRPRAAWPPAGVGAVGAARQTRRGRGERVRPGRAREGYRGPPSIAPERRSAARLFQVQRPSDRVLVRRPRSSKGWCWPSCRPDRHSSVTPSSRWSSCQDSCGGGSRGVKLPRRGVGAAVHLVDRLADQTTQPSRRILALTGARRRNAFIRHRLCDGRPKAGFVTHSLYSSLPDTFCHTIGIAMRR